MTTVNCRIDEISQCATRILIDQIEAGQPKGVEIEFDNELIIRESCGYREKTRDHQP